MEQNFLPVAIAIIFCLGAIVIGQGVSYGTIWLVEKIEKIFSKKNKN